MRLLVPLTLFCTLLAVPCIARACEISFRAGDRVDLCYENKIKSLELKTQSRTWNVKLYGYSIGEPKVLTLSDGDIVIAVVDLAGLSAGGEVRIFLYDGETLKQSCNDAALYANSLLTLRTRYIVLMQHVTKNYFEASSILEVSPSGWRQTPDSTAWDLIVERYEQAYRTNEVSDADFYASMARAYAIMHDSKKEAYYFSKLGSTSHGGSPSTLKTFRRALDYQASHLKSGKWCLVP